MQVYNIRTDLQTAYPEAANGGNIINLLSWAAISGITTDGAHTTLAPYASSYVVMNVYDKRADLQGAFPEAANMGNIKNLLTWAGQSGIVTDSASAKLAPYAATYRLMQVYNVRTDLQTAYPEVATGTLTNLLSWAAISGITTDGAHTILSPYASTYVVMNVYDSRADLQGAFPEAANMGNIKNLLTWAGQFGITTDGSSATLAPYAATYRLMQVYNVRADLQGAFPMAANAGDMTS